MITITKSELTNSPKFRELFNLFTNTLKVAWYPVANFLGVLILTQNHSFEANMDANIVFLFVQGLLNLVIIQPTITTRPDVNVNWTNIALIRYILAAIVIFYNSYYALFMCVVILIDVYSKISNKYNVLIYLPGAALLVGLFYINELAEFQYWYLSSALFIFGSASIDYMVSCIKRHYMNSLSVFFQWFYTVGFLIVLSKIFIGTDLSDIRAIQVFFGLSSMVVALLEFNALKNKLPKTTALRFLVPIGIGAFALFLKNDLAIVLTFCISSVIYMMSMDIAIRIKSQGNFWAINVSHRYAFFFQTVMIGVCLLFHNVLSLDTYTKTLVIIMIIGPSVIFYQKAKSVCKSY